jgi:hypothetical protein
MKLPEKRLRVGKTIRQENNFGETVLNLLEFMCDK